MTGNAEEYVMDSYKDIYDAPPARTPRIVTGAYEHVTRGGAFNAGPYELRTTYRRHRQGDLPLDCVGFRIAVSETGDGPGEGLSGVPGAKD